MTKVVPSIIKYFVMVLGNTLNSHETFVARLASSQNLRRVSEGENCDAIIAFVPVVSRAGTDISAAVEKISQNKPVVLVVLHHTFDPDYKAPDSKLCVKKDNMFAVDCLFYEDQGLLTCPFNDDAIKAVQKHLSRVDCSEKVADEPKGLPRNQSNDGANRAVKKNLGSMADPEKVADEAKGLLRNQSNDGANRAVKKNLGSMADPEVDHSSHRWIFLVVGLIASIVVGAGVGIALGFGVGVAAGVAAGLIVCAVFLVTVIVIWFKCFRSHNSI